MMLGDGIVLTKGTTLSRQTGELDFKGDTATALSSLDLDRALDVAVDSSLGEESCVRQSSLVDAAKGVVVDGLGGFELLLLGCDASNEARGEGDKERSGQHIGDCYML